MSADAISAGSIDGGAGDAGDAARPDHDSGPLRGDAGPAVDASPAADAKTDENDADPAPGPPPLGVSLAIGSNITLRGVTSDGFVIYTVPSTYPPEYGDELFASSLDGGAAIRLGFASKVVVDGAAVLWWTKLDGTMGAPALDAWTNAHGNSTLSTSVTLTTPVVSPDGTLAAFIQSDSTNGQTLVVESLDRAVPHHAELLPQLRCFDKLVFGSNNSLFVGHCADSPGAGSFYLTLSVFAGASWSRRDLLSDATNNDWWIDPTGTWVVSATAALDVPDYVMQMVRASDGQAYPMKMSPYWNRSAFSDDGKSYFKLTRDTASGGKTSLDRVSLATQTTTTLTTRLGDCAFGPNVLAPDGRHIFCGTEWVATDTGAVTPWVPTLPTDARGYPVGFTADSAYVLYDEWVPNGMPRYLDAIPVSGGTAIHLASEVRGQQQVTFTPLNGSKVLTEDSGSHALVVVDATRPGAPHTIAAQASAWFLGADRSKLAYLTTSNPPGIYVVSTQ